jgi:hypothetical protein
VIYYFAGKIGAEERYAETKGQRKKHGNIENPNLLRAEKAV